MVDVSGLGTVRDVGLLESAVARPQTTVMGELAYPTLELMAAALLHSVVKNHALHDGNKRLGWLMTVVFVGMNGHRIGLTSDEAFTLTWSVADGTLRDVEDIAARLRVVPRADAGG